MRLLVALVLGLVACEPELTITRYAVQRAQVEHCVQVQGQVEQCQEPSTILDRVPVVVERSVDNSVVLYAGDPESGADRAYLGSERGEVITVQREQLSDDQGGGCMLRDRSDLSLTLADDTLQGSERRVLVEGAACNITQLDRITRTDWHWNGTLVDDG